MKNMINAISIGLVATAIPVVSGITWLSSNSNPVQTPSPVEEVVVEVPKTWICPECTPEEQYVLKELQRGTKIKDRNALATILGNIKQESKLIANICEGGARVPYTDCHRGGYGIIQWTSKNRYLGLGNFAKKYGCNPSTLECQTRYMINEDIFVRTLPAFEGGGQSVTYYMKPAYRWLGWGIKGKRELYSYDYTRKFRLS